MFFTLPLSAATISAIGGSTWSNTPPALGPSWDGNPPGTAVDILSGQVDEYLLSGGVPGMFSFSAGTYNVTLLTEVAGYAGSNQLGWAPLSNLATFNPIFDGPDSPIMKQTIAPLEGWAFVINTGGGDVFSSSSIDRFLAMRSAGSTNGWSVGVEDLRSPTDYDFNDQIISVEAVPEPTTSLLMGTALIGLALLRKRYTKR
ncbi:MAG: hypothetical protein COV34_02660 [Candidatus Zambryskibacteria bacterium CG10_big_fil_rev_8_21_14_0_10_42_12]|uniref:Ice-binding protein C-terminal domain-containing protein n=1 Tax=Candidatus Zambryskibacteria bacterium CG10_big_fil_rev_8_21_14_0_10_42_12 TaxID=1975115 RepID=A0A2H0QVW6_9BACT|nr:MAG: hypothetical protein COV34_02660 [Candidatus Zambryskibacteria bacterium CG10_big_fil_rev_8_21_14_0_10_42_12]